MHAMGSGTLADFQALCTAEIGPVEIEVPRDLDASFQPRSVGLGDVRRAAVAEPRAQDVAFPVDGDPDNHIDRFVAEAPGRARRPVDDE